MSGSGRSLCGCDDAGPGVDQIDPAAVEITDVPSRNLGILDPGNSRNQRIGQVGVQGAPLSPALGQDLRRDTRRRPIERDDAVTESTVEKGIESFTEPTLAAQ